jgi:hypothetical protein
LPKNLIYSNKPGLPPPIPLVISLLLMNIGNKNMRFDYLMF